MIKERYTLLKIEITIIYNKKYYKKLKTKNKIMLKIFIKIILSIHKISFYLKWITKIKKKWFKILFKTISTFKILKKITKSSTIMNAYSNLIILIFI